MNKDIRKARQNLRKIHDQYQQELHDVILKVDKMLEILEGSNEEEVID